MMQRPRHGPWVLRGAGIRVLDWAGRESKGARQAVGAVSEGGADVARVSGAAGGGRGGLGGVSVSAPAPAGRAGSRVGAAGADWLSGARAGRAAAARRAGHPAARPRPPPLVSAPRAHGPRRRPP